LFVFTGSSYAEGRVNSEEETKLWEIYYHNTINISDPHTTLLLANRYFQIEGMSGGRAADLGAGAGRDTLFLLSNGWQVFALDAEELSIEII